MIKFALAISFVAYSFSPNVALSDMSISAYQNNIRSSSKQAMTYFYLEAVGTGITWTNSISASRLGFSLFCSPKKFRLKGEVAASVLNQHLSSPQGQQLKRKDSVSLGLLTALMYRFPCR